MVVSVNPRLMPREDSDGARGAVTLVTVDRDYGGGTRG
jgi:hypothetical protein